jgi:hypothetical protein
VGMDPEAAKGGLVRVGGASPRVITITTTNGIGLY